MEEFIPSTLGVALVEGYDTIGFENSLSKPFLRKEMEVKMKNICEGTMTRGDVVHSSLEEYREMFIKTSRQVNVLKNVSFFQYRWGRGADRVDRWRGFIAKRGGRGNHPDSLFCIKGWGGVDARDGCVFR